MKTLVGRSAHHIENSKQFIETIKTIRLDETDILVSFDVESLFTKVPLPDTIELLRPHFDPPVVNLFRHCLTSSYFVWKGNFYEQTDGVAMGSPLSPIIADFFMEDFEIRALQSAMKKPKHWYRYVDDTFVVWQHGKESLQMFLDHLNSIHPNIKFTMEIENNSSLPFLDVLVNKKKNGSLGHQVYRKPTHTDRYLNALSNHHPAQKITVIKTLVERARTITEPNLLEEEFSHLRKTLQENGYKLSEINRAIKPRITQPREEKEVLGMAVLPYVEDITVRISRLLSKKGIKTVFTPTAKISQLLRNPKDKRDPLATTGIYSIPCECGKVYIGMTSRSIKTRICEHQRHLRLGQPERSAVAEHAISNQHAIMFGQAKVIARTNGYFNLARREAIEIEQHPHNFNRENDFYLSKTWTPVLKNKQKVFQTQTTNNQHHNNKQKPNGIPTQTITTNKQYNPVLDTTNNTTTNMADTSTSINRRVTRSMSSLAAQHQNSQH